MNVNKTKNCILFNLSLDKYGYGQKWHKGKLHRAHRVAYVEANNLPIESIEGLVIRHKCDNPACVNPDHLETGTNKDNSLDMVSRKRQINGERHWNCRLTDEQCLNIIQEYIKGSTLFGSSALAKKYGISRQQIVNIATGKNRSYIKSI